MKQKFSRNQQKQHHLTNEPAQGERRYLRADFRASKSLGHGPRAGTTNHGAVCGNEFAGALDRRPNCTDKDLPLCHLDRASFASAWLRWSPFTWTGRTRGRRPLSRPASGNSNHSGQHSRQTLAAAAAPHKQVREICIGASGRVLHLSGRAGEIIDYRLARALATARISSGWQAKAPDRSTWPAEDCRRQNDAANGRPTSGRARSLCVRAKELRGARARLWARYLDLLHSVRARPGRDHSSARETIAGGRMGRRRTRPRQSFRRVERPAGVMITSELVEMRAAHET